MEAGDAVRRQRRLEVYVHARGDVVNSSPGRKRRGRVRSRARADAECIVWRTWPRPSQSDRENAINKTTECWVMPDGTTQCAAEFA